MTNQEKVAQFQNLSKQYINGNLSSHQNKNFRLSIDDAIRGTINACFRGDLESACDNLANALYINYEIANCLNIGISSDLFSTKLTTIDIVFACLNKHTIKNVQYTHNNFMHFAKQIKIYNKVQTAFDKLHATKINTLNKND